VRLFLFIASAFGYSSGADIGSIPARRSRLQAAQALNGERDWRYSPHDVIHDSLFIIHSAMLVPTNGDSIMKMTSRKTMGGAEPKTMNRGHFQEKVCAAGFKFSFQDADRNNEGRKTQRMEGGE